MDQDRRQQIKKSFEQFDEDGNGKIDLIEFRKLLESIGSDLGRAEAEAAFDAIDADETGMINYDEFFDWWSQRKD